MQTTLNIIGAGRLGKTFGRLLVTKANVKLLGVCNRSLESAQEAALFIEEGRAYGKIGELPSADFILISTADEQIEECVKELLSAAQLQPGTVVAHCGGALSSEILAPLRAKGCAVASMHPMHSFADPALSVEHFAGTFCALEGDSLAVELLEQLLSKLGAQLSRVDPAMKALYHAGGVMASNYLVTLFDKAVLCLERSGSSREMAQQVALSLMTNALKNVKDTGSSQKALTGPIKRGEAEVVAMHLNAMPNETVATMYRALGVATLDIAGIGAEQEARLRGVLT
jgi:predicted short-subunit dehydrogenase-like oxidoreductase (DUF2520 family)